MVQLIEVGPRDGLQNESAVLDPGVRIDYIASIVRSGLTRIEAVSFVREDRVPQMAGAEEVMAGVPRVAGVSYSALVLNARGVERALAARVDEINFVVLASETFSRQNQGTSIAAAIDSYAQVREMIAGTGVRSTVTVGAAFGCPFEGDTPLSRVREIVARVTQSGVDELSLADTIGVAVPAEVLGAIDVVRSVTSVPLRMHLHNTRNTGYANALAAVSAGVVSLDASTGGIGGCPFAPAATGNIATEDVLYQLRRSGYDVRGNFNAIVDAGRWIGAALGKTHVEGMLGAAGWFPSLSSARPGTQIPADAAE